MFLLRIYFAGLIAFAAGPNGQVHVLLVDASDGHNFSDGTSMPPHVPLLLARGVCTGDCGRGNQEVADYLAGGVGPASTAPAANLAELNRMLGSGAVWNLDDTILTLETGDPGSGVEIDLAWFADVEKIAPGAGMVDPRALAPKPTGGLITARLTLNSGMLKAYSLLHIEDQVVDVAFRPLTDPGPTGPSSPAQPLAGWVVAEIQVQGDSFSLEKSPFPNGPTQMVRISPLAEDQGVVEMAILNLPLDNYMPGPAGQAPETVGKHFDLFYNLAANRPAEPHMVPVAIMEPDGKARRARVDIEDRKATEFVNWVLGSNSRGNPGRPICAVAFFSNGQSR